MPAPRRRLLSRGGLIVLSYCFPPISVGPSFLLDRLLSQFDLGETVVFAGEPDRFHAQDDKPPASEVTIRRRDVPAWWPEDDRAVTVGRRSFSLRVRSIGNVLVGLRVAVEAVRALRSDSARALLIVYPKQHFLLAGVLASVVSRRPLLIYFFDAYVGGGVRNTRAAQAIEWVAFRRAHTLFGMSDAHCQQLRERLAHAHVDGVRVIELPHTYAPNKSLAQMTLKGQPSIVFTGAVYDAQADAIRRLIAALARPALADLNPHLHIVSQHDETSLASFGVTPSPNVSIHTGTIEESLAAQRSADILFLPMAFDARPVTRQTASPSKMPEYLASRRPILVHAPADSYVARYAAQHGFAEVVDRPDADALAVAIRRLATDSAHGRALIDAATATFERHHVATVANTFATALAEAVGSA